MHDCPKCRVPLHGHEEFCPVCGLKQRVKPEFQGQSMHQYDKPFNPLGLVLATIVAIGILFYILQNSWVVQLIKRGREAPVGDAALSPPAAREKLENAVLQNLAGLSKTCKFVYTANEKPVDRNYAQPVELTIDVSLKDASKRRSIVEPVKSLMVPAHINTLTLNDSRAHATVTYSVSGDVPDNTDDAGGQTASSSTAGSSQEQ